MKDGSKLFKGFAVAVRRLQKSRIFYTRSAPSNFGGVSV